VLHDQTHGRDGGASGRCGDAIEQALHAASRLPAANARLGAISFVERFGAAFNEHRHFHACVSDGLFTESVGGRLQIIETQVDVTAAEAVQAKVRQRVLVAYRRRGWLEADVAVAGRADPRPASGRTSVGPGDGGQRCFCTQTQHSAHARPREPATGRGLVGDGANRRGAFSTGAHG